MDTSSTSSAIAIGLFSVMLIAIVGLVYVGRSGQSIPIAAETDVAAVPTTETELALLNSRTIIDSVVGENEVVSYVYLGEPVPEKITPDEDVTLRTEYSFTRYLGSEGEEDEKMSKMEARTFPQKVFHKTEAGEWFYLEHATSSLLTWKNRKISFLHRMRDLFIPFAYADTVYGLAGDGYIYGEGQATGNSSSICRQDAWAVAYGIGTASNGDLSLIVGGSTFVEANEAPPPALQCTANLNRAFLPFDTSFLPVRSNVSSVSLNVYVESVSVSDNDGNDYVVVLETSQASHTSLVSADYADFGSEVSATVDLSGVSLGYLSMPISPALLPTIIKRAGQTSSCSSQSGLTCLGLREGHDINVDAPILGGTSMSVSSSEATGVSQDPYLSITYTIPDTLRLQGANIRVQGGSVIIK